MTTAPWRRLAAALAVTGGIAYLLFTGPRDTGRYPAAAASPYKLPWPAGIERQCIQSNRGVVSHRGWEEHAYDFGMPVGSPVCAARAGTVKRVVIHHHGNGLNAPNNLIIIDHGDGTQAAYLHLERGGSLVRPGDSVRQGQRIALSGHVGRSLAPHLHFHVTDTKRTGTLPITFADVPDDEGIPRMFKSYTSRNAPPPG